MNDVLMKNVDTEIEMLREVSNYIRRAEFANPVEQKLLKGAVGSLLASMKILNNSIPKILKGVAPIQKLGKSTKTKKKEGLERVSYDRLDSKVKVVLSSKDKEKFLRELSISENFIRKLKKRRRNKDEDYAEFKAARGYLKIANRFFLPQASRLVRKGNFKSLSIGIRRANIEILFEGYVAMMLFTTFLSVVFSILLGVFLMFFEVSFIYPYFSIYEGSYLSRLGAVIFIPLILPIVTFLSIYLYPSTEKKSIGKKIEQELPFAVIHMSAISGSGIEPSEIFKIIGMNKDYPALRKEFRKVLNQINLYGYDLLTALTNAAKTAPSEKLADLFGGLSSTITSGADLSNFLEKRSESLLLDYRLEREKYTKLVETFLDIYISIVIAAPMVFMLLLILMAVSGLQTQFSSFQLSLISVLGIALLNIFFIIFLQIKQPSE